MKLTKSQLKQIIKEELNEVSTARPGATEFVEEIFEILDEYERDEVVHSNISREIKIFVAKTVGVGVGVGGSRLEAHQLDQEEAADCLRDYRLGVITEEQYEDCLRRFGAFAGYDLASDFVE